jgi:hypothetical protein
MPMNVAVVTNITPSHIDVAVGRRSVRVGGEARNPPHEHEAISDDERSRFLSAIREYLEGKSGLYLARTGGVVASQWQTGGGPNVQTRFSPAGQKSTRPRAAWTSLLLDLSSDAASLSSGGAASNAHAARARGKSNATRDRRFMDSSLGWRALPSQASCLGVRHHGAADDGCSRRLPRQCGIV